MPTVSDFLTLRAEVVKGELDGAIQAVDGLNTGIEADPHAFLTATYPTADIRKVLEVLDARYNRRERGQGTVIVRSPMGGGKSHLLLTLRYWFEAPVAVRAWQSMWADMRFPSPAQRPVVILRSMSHVPVANLWDALFEGLGCSELAGEVGGLGHPGKELVRRALAGRPVVLVLDELEGFFETHSSPEVRARNIQFLKVLTNIAADGPDFTLIVSVLGNDHALYAEMERDGAEEVSLDDATDQTKVVLHRLFENWHLLRSRRHDIEVVIDRYLDAYSRVEQVRFDRFDLRQKMLESYPFHPALMDRIMRRFQESNREEFGLGPRRALFLLQHVAKAACDRVDLITAADVDLFNVDIRGKISRINNRLTPVALNNIVDTPEVPLKAQLITIILLYSLAELGVPGATYADIVLHMVRPDEPGRINAVDSSLDRLRRVAFNLHYIGDADRYLLKRDEAPEVRVYAEAMDVSKYTDVRAKEFVLQKLRDLWGFERLAFYDVPGGQFVSPEEYRGLVQWQTFRHMRDRLDNGQLALIVSTRFLNSTNRFETVFWGLAYQNSFLLVEPVDARFDLSNLHHPDTRDLLDKARRVLAAQFLMEANPLETAEHRARQQTYRRIAETEELQIRDRLRTAYGYWIHWDDINPQAEAWDRGSFTLTRPDGHLWDALHNKLQDTYFERVYREHFERRVRTEPGNSFFNSSVNSLRERCLKEIGFPPLYDDTFYAAVRTMVNNGEIRLEETGGATFQGPDRRIPSDFPNDRLGAFVILQPRAVGPILNWGETITERPGLHVAENAAEERGGQEDRTREPQQATTTNENRAHSDIVVPPQSSRDGLVEAFDRRVASASARLTNVEIHITAAIRAGTGAFDLKGKIVGRVPLASSDYITAQFRYSLAGPFSKTELASSLRGLPDVGLGNYGLTAHVEGEG